VDQVRRGTAFLQPADQHGDIRALSAARRVQFVEHQKPQSAARPIQEALVFGTHQHQFGHDVVRQQDLWGMQAERAAHGLVALARVLGKRDRKPAPRAPLVPV
jgi:hypothetical protein